ncbi:MAG: 23S rRNA (pseudouridine(1915)-N(3))-methyltransferase RlmH [Blastocatellia bacterium]
MRLQFVWIGKTRDRHCAALAGDYLDRIGRFAPYDISELREYSGAAGEDDRRVVAAESARILEAVDRSDFVILLDEQGREYSSTAFADLIRAKRETGVKRLAFIIGGFAGVSADVKQRANLRLALSRLTMTHEMARVVLVEQVYRAFTLLAGMPYHKF